MIRFHMKFDGTFWTLGSGTLARAVSKLLARPLARPLPARPELPILWY